jgi:hypothetical protein
MPEILSRALEYVNQGLAVFPLAAGSKMPTKGSGGFQDASTDPEQVRQWWAGIPIPNIGIATGQPSKVFVVDLDVSETKDGLQAWAKLQKKHGKAPDTFTVQTPRGGRHLYFSMPDTHLIRCGTDRLGKGIDVRGDGGYVVAAPSLVGGKQYRVINATEPAAPPAWLVELVRPCPNLSKVAAEDKSPNSATSDEPKIREALKFISADNYDQWLKVGMALHSWDRTKGLCVFDEWSQTVPEKYNAEELAKKWRSFHEGDGVTIGTVFHLAQQASWKVERAGSDCSRTSGLPEIDNAAALLADETITIPAELVEGVIHQGCKAVIGSNSKARKTWLLLDLALSVQAGVKFWKWNTHQGRVLFINFEVHKAFTRSRIQRLAEAKGITDVSNLDIWNLRGHAAPLWRLLPELLAIITPGRYALIVIDPIYKALGGREENATGDIGELCNELERIAVHSGAAVVFSAHFSKGNQASKDPMDRISGSGVFGRDPDSIITLTKHDTYGAYTVDLVLRNFPEHPSFVVRWEHPLMSTAEDLNPEDLKQAKGRKRAFNEDQLLEALDSDRLAPGEWLKRAEDDFGMSKRTFHDLRSSLQLSKRVRKSKIDRKYEAIKQ